MDKVLILGNGISRLAFDDYIRRFSGPVWGCNRIYLDYGDTVSLITGHVEIMGEVYRYRKKHGLAYSILSGHLGDDTHADEVYTCPHQFLKDSGTSLVAEALHRGYDVYLCGFDLGGKDVYSPEHDTMGKEIWVRRWRLLLEYYGPDRVHFVGYDHLPYLLSNEHAMKYVDLYRSGKPHIDDTCYHGVYYSWKEDYERVMEALEMALLFNKGKREWKLKELAKPLTAGGKATVPRATAEKYVGLYPREFEMIVAEEEEKKKPEKIELSDAIKELIGEIKGLGPAGAVKLFTEKQALTEDAQAEILGEILAEKNGPKEEE